MRLPRARFTIMGMMVASAVVAAVLAVLPEPAFVLHLPGSSTAAITLSDGSLVRPQATADIGVTRLGALLLASVAGVIALVISWAAGHFFRSYVPRPSRPE
jgi:hypothetical protein